MAKFTSIAWISWMTDFPACDHLQDLETRFNQQYFRNRNIWLCRLHPSPPSETSPRNHGLVGVYTYHITYSDLEVSWRQEDLNLLLLSFKLIKAHKLSEKTLSSLFLRFWSSYFQWHHFDVSQQTLTNLPKIIMWIIKHNLVAYCSWWIIHQMSQNLSPRGPEIFRWF